MIPLPRSLEETMLSYGELSGGSGHTKGDALNKEELRVLRE